ncbi:MAG: TonB-dependent receptor [Endomicrobia bacterium]|nr:TonB-dependent receptor [Endomicrobiia bacterium]MCL2506787.1 TonB-dependent receptor [Endomicrobiia bacterium]
MRKVATAVFFYFLLNNISFSSETFLSLEKTGNVRTESFLTHTVVSEAQIENQNVPMALDLISSVPGVFVSKAASVLKSDVSIRGMGDSFRNIGLFIDGRPEKVSVYGCAVSQTLLSGNIESIEIIKTPDSVLYGSDAFGGAVNIITHNPSKPLEAEISLSYGSYNTQNYYANVGQLVDNVLYQVSANKVSSDGHLKNSGYDATDLYGKFGYIINDTSSIMINGKYFNGKENEPEAIGLNNMGHLITLNPSSYEFRRGGVDAKYNKNFYENSMEILAFEDFGEHKFSNGFNSKDETFGLFASFENTSFANNVFKYGLEYRYSYANVIAGPPSVKIGNWNKSEIALFALDEYSFNSKTGITAGARYNYDEISGSDFAARTGLSYGVTDLLTARVSYSRSFRTPYINELYSLPISNADLKAQTQDSYEIGVASKYFGVIFDVSGFISKGENIIQVVSGKFQNSGTYEFKGFEVSADKEVVKNLKLFAGYSYLDPGKLTQGTVKNKIDLSADYKIWKFGFYVSGMFVFDYYAANNFGAKLEDFNVFNAKTHFNVTDEFSIFLAADNFTDQKYNMFVVSFGQAAIYEMPGATYTIGARYKF